MKEQRHLRLAWGGATDQGRVRAVNQDAMFADRGLFVVADGMGGHQGGEVAANLAVRTVASEPHDTAETLLGAVKAANQVVHDTSIARPELHGMGTTLTAIAVINDERGPHFGIVNVGDSRIYRQRNRTLHQLTYDHSYVAELMRRGDIDEQEAAHHPYRNMLTRAVGVHAEVDVDDWAVEPEAGDRYILCSDGLTNEVSDAEINAVLNGNPDVSEAARALVQLANLNGGRDNATVLIVDVRIDDPTGVPTPAATSVIEVSDSGEYLETTDELDEIDVEIGIEIEIETIVIPVAEPEEIEGGEVDAGDLEQSATAVASPVEAPELVVPPDGDAAAGPILEPTTPAPPPALDLDESTAADNDIEAKELLWPDDSPVEDVVHSEGKADNAENGDGPPTSPSDEPTAPQPVVEAPLGPQSETSGEAPMTSWLREPVSVTSRAIAIALGVIVLVVAVIAAVGWYARGGYYVGTLGDEVVVFKGRSGGMLWFEPTVESRAGVLLTELTADDRALVTAGHETESRDGAEAFISDLRTRTTTAIDEPGDPPDDSSDDTGDAEPEG